MKIKKAVITAAGARQRLLPLQTLIDRDGEEKSVLAILIEQALLANIEEVCVVVWESSWTSFSKNAVIRMSSVPDSHRWVTSSWDILAPSGIVGGRKRLNGKNRRNVSSTATPSPFANRKYRELYRCGPWLGGSRKPLPAGIAPRSGETAEVCDLLRWHKEWSRELPV